MSEYDSRGVDDDHVRQAAQRILRQFHLEQSDRSEESGGIGAAASASAAPDNLHALRLALDEMSARIEHIERLMSRREDVFMATLERIARNQAKSDGLLDALSVEVARIESHPAIDADRVARDREAETRELMQDFGSMMSLGRTLLDEVRDLHAAAVVTTEGAGAPIGQR
jgi:hypothetical protein